MKLKLFLFFVFMCSGVQSYQLQHRIVFFEGSQTDPCRVDSIGVDSVRYQLRGVDILFTIPMDSVLYIHNGEGKIFYVSEKLNTFILANVGKSGEVTLTNSKVVSFDNMEEELRMYRNKLYFTLKRSTERIPISIFNIHKLEMDFSPTAEFSVRRGFYAGLGGSVFYYLTRFKSTKQFLDFNLVYNRAFDLYPKAVTVLPLSTIGWLVYDFFFGERELVINPLTP